MAPKKTDPTKAVVRLAFNAEAGIADLASKDWFFDVGEINDRLVAKHGFEDHQRHADFLLEAIDIV